MKLSTLLESEEGTIFEWLHDPKNITILKGFTKVDNKKVINKHRVKITNGEVELLFSAPYMDGKAADIFLSNVPPFKIKHMSCADLVVSFNNLKACPKWLDGNLQVNGDGPWIGGPNQITGFLKCIDMVSLKGIHEHIKVVEGKVILERAKNDILGLIHMDVGKVMIYRNEVTSMTLGLHKALKIITPYLGQGLKGVTKAQRELIDADLDDFADL